jgi:TP53 regulating kinase-like protein
MEYIQSSTQLKEVLKVIYSDIDITKFSKLIEKIINNLGEAIAKLHNCDIIHGDLTTSNMIIKAKNELGIDSLNMTNLIINLQDYSSFYIIDFGLSYVSSNVEDKAVDLYVLKRAIISANPKSEEVFDKMMEVYEQVANKGKLIVDQMKKVEQRGRKKVAFG